MRSRCRCGQFVSGEHPCPSVRGIDVPRDGSANSNWRGGKSTHPLYAIFHDMIGRCSRPSHKRYADYGGRGITVCTPWRDDFWSFVADMGNRPMQPNGRPYLLDRIDNDAGYTPENCRWTTDSVSSSNRRRSSWARRERNEHGQYA